MKRALLAVLGLLLAGLVVAFFACTSSPSHSDEVVVCAGDRWLRRGLATATGPILFPGSINCLAVAGDSVLAGGRADNRAAVLRTHDLGGAWSKEAVGNLDEVRGLCALSARDVYCAAAVYSNTDHQYHAVLLHSDGTTWNRWTADFPSMAMSVTASSEDALALVQRHDVGGSEILRSTDHGATWSAIAKLRAPSYAWSIARRGAGDLVVAGSKPGSIARSKDGGATWQPASVEVPGSMPSVAVGGDTVLVVGSGGTIARSTDGEHWTLQHTPTTADLRGVWASASGEAWACGRGGTLLHSTDGGATWTLVPSGVSTAFQAVTVAGGRVLAAGELEVSSGHANIK